MRERDRGLEGSREVGGWVGGFMAKTKGFIKNKSLRGGV